jgi:3,4-dihydroxy 2-butanone 4-phosphate synthase/GTP cyclohydrolase II
MPVATIEEALEDIRQGRMVILMDDQNRENEGDLTMAAELVTPEAINFMATWGRGLICLPLTEEKVARLGLTMMVRDNTAPFGTAFTVSIDGVKNVTTGISASDRAETILAAIADDAGPGDLCTPGHIFPLRAKNGGVLVRTGQTEGSVDLCRLAGLKPAGVICEIMKDDGTMARLPDLVPFAQFHGLKVATIADLIAYRLRNDSLVERVLATRLTRRHGGEFRLIVYVNKITGAEHLALIKGDISGPDPVPVRMHAINVLDDVIQDETAGRAGVIESCIRTIGEAGRGVVVLIRDSFAQSFVNQVRQRHEIPGDPGAASMEVSVTTGAETAFAPPALRDYGVGAQILRDLGVTEMILLTNHNRTVVGLEGYGIRIVGHRPIEPVV